MIPSRKNNNLLQRIISSYIIRILLYRLLMIWVVITLTFFIIRALPGNPIDIFVLRLTEESGMTEDEARRYASTLLHIDLGAPLGKQYCDFLGNLLHGDLGTSYTVATHKPVMQLIGANLPWTLFSVGVSLLISFVTGIFMGMFAAYQRNAWSDHLITNLSAITDAIPNTLTAIVLILMVGVVWKLVPITELRGAVSSGVEPGFTSAFLLDVLKHYLWPGSIYVLTAVGSWTLTMRTSTLSTLGEDYVTAARARGLSDLRILTAYVGRNACLPLITALAISLGFVVGGSVLIEKIFVYRGLGYLLSTAIEMRDYPVMQGILLTLSITVMLFTMLADLLYGSFDPRLRVGGKLEN